jgi:hypothetical protein
MKEALTHPTDCPEILQVCSIEGIRCGERSSERIALFTLRTRLLSERALTEEAGGPKAGFQQEGQKKMIPGKSVLGRQS